MDSEWTDRQTDHPKHNALSTIDGGGSW